jgi:hypothetical protein
MEKMHQEQEKAKNDEDLRKSKEMEAMCVITNCQMTVREGADCACYHLGMPRKNKRRLKSIREKRRRWRLVRLHKTLYETY